MNFPIVSYVHNFVVETLLILTHGLGLDDQTMNDSPFYVIYVIGPEMKITTGMSRFPVQFRSQFWTPLHDQNVQEWKGIISFNE
jgi:hypothetical protein